MTFQLHPVLERDCIALGRFQLCRLLLMNDRQFPWFILVPEQDAVSEIYQLNTADRQRLIEESSRLAETLARIYRADKMNVAMIGNLVPQLHLHHVVRYRDDIAWPLPVWGKFPAVPYTEQQIAEICITLQKQFSGKLTAIA